MPDVENFNFSKVSFMNETMIWGPLLTHTPVCKISAYFTSIEILRVQNFFHAPTSFTDNDKEFHKKSSFHRNSRSTIISKR